jgi:hypothetical protein
MDLFAKQKELLWIEKPILDDGSLDQDQDKNSSLLNKENLVKKVSQLLKHLKNGLFITNLKIITILKLRKKY